MRASRIHTATLAFAASAFVIAGMAAPVQAQDLGKSYDIMAPEPWLPPRHRSVVKPRKPSASAGISDYSRPRRSDGLTNAERIPKSVPLAVPQQPQPTFVPGVGTVPNLPPARGLGATESFNDRAARCAHQSGLFGVPPGQTGTYIRGCTN